MSEKMKMIGFCNDGVEAKKIIDCGYNLAFTTNLQDMSDPARTIYTITGADFTQSADEAYRNGYLNSKRKPLECHGKRGTFHIAINSELYIKHFKNRLYYLKEFTKWPYGLHIGGSRNMLEHSFPEGIDHSKEFWCYGFYKTHPRDPDLSLMQYQVDVWEDITNKMIEIAYEVFPSIKMVTTAFSCPSYSTSKKALVGLECGSELWYMLKRMSIVHKDWYNIFFDLFKVTSKKNQENRFMEITAAINSYGLRKNLMIGVSDGESLNHQSKSSICDEAKLYGSPFLAYMMGIHGGILVNRAIDDSTDLLKKRLKSINKFQI